MVHHKPQVLSERPILVLQSSSEAEGKEDHTPSKLPFEERLDVGPRLQDQTC